MRGLIKVKWGGIDNKWHILHGINGRFIQEIYDCENTHKFFEGLDKDKAKTYFINIEPYAQLSKRRNGN